MAVVPNGVDVDYFAPMEIGADKDYVVFEGNMDFAPNIDTARRLALEILPLLSKHAPNVRIGLVGRDPAPEVRQLASSRVEVTGTVDDVRPYLAKASVFACPMKLGSGIKNKILQAWAMGRPVVATSTSLGGLSALDGVNILVRDTPKAFAAAVANVISDPELAKSIGAAGRATAVREYSWQQRAKQLDSLLKAVVSRTEEFRGTGQAPIVATMARPHGSLKEPG